MNKLNRLRLMSVRQRRQIVFNGLTVLVLVANLIWWQGTTARADGIWTGPNALFNGVFPRVVVRPTDGDVFVIATDYSSNIYYGDSAHGYNPVTISSVSNSSPARPRAAFDSNGTLYVVWQQRNLSSGQYCTYYTTIDKNNNVGAIRNLTSELGVNTGKTPDVAVSPVDGHIYIAQEYDNAAVSVFESDNGGVSFGNLVPLGSGQPGNTGTRITVDKNNILHFVYVNGTDVIVRDRINGTWTSGVRADTSGTPGSRAFWPSITTGPNGDAYVAWQEDAVSGNGANEISYDRWDHSSQRWQNEIQNVSQTNSSVAARVPSVAVDTNGLVWITWEIDNNGNPEGGQYIYSNDGGFNFRNPDVIAGANFSRTGPWSDASPGNGEIYFAAQWSGSGSFQIYLAATKSDGSGGGTTGGGGGGGGTGTGSNGWSNPAAVLGGVYPTVAIRPSDGDVFVVATDYANNIYYGDSAHGYSSVTISSNANSAPARPRAVFDANNNLQLVWMQRGSSGNYDTMYTSINSNGNIGAIRDLTQEASLATGKEPDIAVSPVDGHILIAEEYNNGAVGVIESNNGGANFSGIVPLGSGTAGNTGTRLTVDKNNIVHFAYVSSANVIARERVNGSWTGPITVDNLGTPGHRAFWPSITADPDGDVYVAWQEDAVAVSGGSEISFARWDHGSQSWQGEIQNVSQTTSTSINARVPSVTVSSDGKVYITFEVDSNGGSPDGANFNVSSDGGRTFGTAGTLITQNFVRPGPWSDAKAGNGQIYFAGQLDGGNGFQIWLSSITTVNKNPPTGNPQLTSNAPGSFAVRLNLSNGVQDPGTGVATVQVSNDPNFGSYLELPYTNNLTSVLWSLGATQYGGNYNSGTKTVYVRYKSGTGYINATPYALTNNVTETTASFTSNLYQAEGDTTGSKSEYISFYNAAGKDGTISVVYRDTSSNPSFYGYPIAAGGRATVPVAVQNKHASIVSSDVPLQGEDLNFNGNTGMDGIVLNGTPANNFYFANGSTNGGSTSFELYNPGATAANVTVTFTNWGGGTIGSAQTFSVPSQTVVSVPNVPANANFATQIAITNNQPIFATRRMTLANGAVATMNGVSTTSSGWVFAGGDTGTGNTDSIGAFNPNNFAVTLSYQLYKNDGSLAISTTQTLAANAAIVTPIEQFLHAFGVPNHSGTLTEWQVVLKATDATGKSQPIAAEQQQLARGGSSFGTEQGSTSTASKWVVLSTAIPNVINDNIIITNYSNQAATAQIAAYDEMGNQICTNCTAISIPAYGQVRVPTSSLSGVAGNRVALVVSGSNSLVVEHTQRAGSDASLVLGQPLSGTTTPSILQATTAATGPSSRPSPVAKPNPVTPGSN